MLISLIKKLQTWLIFVFLLICDEQEGDNKNPTCVKKFFLPMTSIVDAEGYDTYNKIVLAYFLGPFYTFCCWDTTSLSQRYKPVQKVENIIIENGNDRSLKW